MRSVHLSAIGHVHGERRKLSELAAELPDDLSALAEDIVTYRVSDAEIWELAAVAAERSLAQCAEPPDALVYVSQNDPDSAGSLARVANRLGLATCDSIAVAGHDCGNFGPALRIARDMVRSGTRQRVLLVLADRARSAQDRLMASGLSLFSDGAAACLVSADAPDSTDASFTVDAIAGRTQVRLDGPDLPGDALLATVRLARDTTADLLAGTGTTPDEFRHVMFANYRTASQKFLCTAMGFPHERILPGSVADLAHCFSADILVTLAQRHADGSLSPGDRLLASASGPHSWSTLALACR
ncbi:3-oxoacyl-[acyl-carrier-protein] synthase III C-terminal domain-containing protein [Kitasatospora sp. MAP5-34]|uniref:3-oxoacyl-[acyl-carrier-protein] synthase III C-terminal domain-containing protein n=1 Tax=Kitasatospora sp. MAP5-34 TaxID=3035102 RepID=UPI002474B1B0|nr:3-oxoacyl-[acyl-carrier-protein] synthase III C-terminal domain-containing protein [Kitasatospora sp. MAP5-34]MDH6578560.1 3-oxoacyl-[acyl-carrier-protein] synthase III [Kitasatospora sp. MAP5-34]